MLVVTIAGEVEGEKEKAPVLQAHGAKERLTRSFPEYPPEII